MSDETPVPVPASGSPVEPAGEAPPPTEAAPPAEPATSEGQAAEAPSETAVPASPEPSTLDEVAAAEAAHAETVAAEGEAPAEGAPSTDAEPEDEPAAKPRAAGRSRTKVAEEARAKALPRFAQTLPRGCQEKAGWLVEAFEKGYEPIFIGRFRREMTSGLDERRVLEARRDWRGILAEEERRAELRELLSTRGALTDDLGARLDRAHGVPAMEDLAAPWLPVTAGRATVARGHGLQALADAIRNAKEATPLSDLAKPFAKEGTEIATLDAALAGARDILAEALCLDATLRARLRESFRRESVITVTLRGDRKGDAGRHGSLVGFAAPAGKVPPLKLLALRRGERERVLSIACEPPEARALEFVHEAATAAFGAEHPHGGFLRAAAEDGYRRILRPLLQAEVRADLKTRADDAASDTFERSLKNLLLGPVGGPRKTLGLRPDVTAGHRVGAVDEAGRTIHAGRLPHEATAGREVAVAALRGLIEAHGIEVVVVGSGGGRKEAFGLAVDALKDLGREVEVTEVPDGGTRALETQAIERPVKTDSGTEIAPEFVGALSLARRYQDPMAEYVRLDPKSLGLGPNLHDVHQGRLKERLEDTIAMCVSHTGVEATTAPAELLAHLPGMDLGKARAFVAWREAGGKLSGKAALGAVEGVGLAAAEQAVGFLRVAGTADPRDRTQLHPEQFGLIEEMAAQVETDVAGLFRDPRARARVDFGRLARPEVPVPIWKYALWQATAGLADPRPRQATPMKPPPGVTIETLRPGLVLEGRVTRAVPFGVFVDVGLGAEGLVPLPHIGDRPGIDPAIVAPVGAVVQARVLEIDVVKRRLTLSMRTDREGPPQRRFDGVRGGADRGPRPDRGGDGGRPRPQPVGAGAPAGGPGGPGGGDRGGGGRPPARAGDRPRSGDKREGGGGPPGEGGKGPGGRRPGAPPRGFGRSSGAGGRDSGPRPFDRDDTSAPRRISLPAEPDNSEATAAEEAALTPEQVMAKKLEELRKKFGRA